MATEKKSILTEEEIAAMNEEYIALNMEAEKTAELQLRKDQGAPIYEERSRASREFGSQVTTPPDGTNVVVYFTPFPVGSFSQPNVIGQAVIELTVHTTKITMRNVHVTKVNGTIGVVFPSAVSLNGQSVQPMLEITGPILNIIKQKIYARI